MGEIEDIISTGKVIADYHCYNCGKELNILIIDSNTRSPLPTILCEECKEEYLDEEEE